MKVNADCQILFPLLEDIHIPSDKIRSKKAIGNAGSSRKCKLSGMSLSPSTPKLEVSVVGVVELKLSSPVYLYHAAYHAQAGPPPANKNPNFFFTVFSDR